MDELIAQITQRTGISEQQARGAAETVIDFLEQKLPAPIAGQVRGLINSEHADSAVKQGQQMLGNLGGMFGKK
jgi:nucleoid DNA-binding protein